MIRLETHPGFSHLSFHEERALPWITDNKGLSSNVNTAMYCTRVVDGALLRACVRHACTTYDALRTRFAADPDGKYHRHEVSAEDCASFTECEVNLPVGDPFLARQVADFCNTPVSIDDASWLRVLLIHAVHDTSVIVISTPHIISDAVSIRLLGSAIWRDYAGRAEGEAPASFIPPRSLRDFAGAQRAWGATQDFQDKLGKLADIVTAGIARIHAIDGDYYAAEPVPSRPSMSIYHRLTPALHARLAELAAECRVSLPNLLAAGTALIIARIFRRQEFCFRLPFSNRILSGSADIVGFLSNDVPVFVSIDPEQSITDFIKAITRNSFIMTTRFGSVPWSVLVEYLKRAGTLSAGRNPFDDYLINVFPEIQDEEPRSGYRAHIFPLSLAAFTTNDLKVWWHKSNGVVIATLKVRIEEADIAQRDYRPALKHVLQLVAAHPERRVGDCLTDIS